MADPRFDRFILEIVELELELELETLMNLETGVNSHDHGASSSEPSE